MANGNRDKLEEFLKHHMFMADDESIVAFFTDTICNGSHGGHDICLKCPLSLYCYNWMTTPGHLNDDSGEIVSAWLKMGE